jgi:hypothetical protein
MAPDHCSTLINQWAILIFVDSRPFLPYPVNVEYLLELTLSGEPCPPRQKEREIFSTRNRLPYYCGLFLDEAECQVLP